MIPDHPCGFNYFRVWIVTDINKADLVVFAVGTAGKCLMFTAESMKSIVPIILG